MQDTILKLFTKLGQFLSDSRGLLNVFTIASLASGLSLIYIGLEEVRQKGVVQGEILYSLFFIYVVSVVSDSLLAMIIERGVWKTPPTPDTQVIANVQTDTISVTPDAMSTGKLTNADSIPLPE